MLRRSIDYSLPKDNKGTGLEEGGIKASPEAKGMISDMLTWAPEKRASAEQVHLKIRSIRYCSHSIYEVLEVEYNLSLLLPIALNQLNQNHFIKGIFKVHEMCETYVCHVY